MAVTNAVAHDSRVQKAAWSAAAAGWDTTLVGVTTGAERVTGTVGGAQVVLVPCPPPALPQRLARAALVRAQKLAGSRGWRRFVWVLTARRSVRDGLPRARDLRRCLAPALVALAPDVLHAHDHTALPAALEAIAALEAQGHPVTLVYDAHEFVPGLAAPSPVWAAAADRVERRGAARADAVITVSALLAERLVERLSLTEPPAVVANAPLLFPAPRAPVGVRAAAALDADVPLVVYAGGVAPQRGMDTVVDAVAQLPEVHVALLTPASKWLDALLDRATARGVRDRVHVLPYVAPDEVPAHLATADVGVIPLLPSPNHDVAMSTKWYDYAQARLPIVVSDVRSMATEVRRLGNGEVFRAGNATSLADALRRVLADPARYRSAYTDEILEEATWQHQVRAMLDVYERLTGATPTRAGDQTPFVLELPG